MGRYSPQELKEKLIENQARVNIMFCILEYIPEYQNMYYLYIEKHIKILIQKILDMIVQHKEKWIHYESDVVVTTDWLNAKYLQIQKAVIKLTYNIQRKKNETTTS